MSGLEVVQIPSDSRGNVDLEALRANLSERVVGLMLTNPNTLGLFDEHVLEVTRLVHEAGGLVYGDGANLNALLGVCRPADLDWTCCTSTCTRLSARRMAAAAPGPGRWRHAGACRFPARADRRGAGGWAIPLIRLA